MSPDGVGLFVAPSRAHRGSVEWFVDLRLHPESVERLENGIDVFAIEMVFVPEGPFAVGDPDPKSAGFGALFQADGSGQHAGPFRVASEAAIEVGSDGLGYETAQYQGDGLGPIPEAFPKGTRAFYLMKYELTQGQYADFLNAIGSETTFDRTGFFGRGYYENRGSIRLEAGRFVAEHPARPMNFITWDDGLAWTDWAGLRPITELEFTKAARGPEPALAGGFPWGTADKTFLQRDVGLDGNLAGPSESGLTDETRTRFGASHYWVMDLAGSVWERVISVGSPYGRTFAGSHGDGNLSGGRADNPDWPLSWAGREGHGYRGGGFYDPGRPEHEFNPHSPIAYRPFGAWAGASPHRAYGYRAGRTALASQ